jgi:post-segregation antitoxin (ccd killing protein)
MRRRWVVIVSTSGGVGLVIRKPGECRKVAGQCGLEMRIHIVQDMRMRLYDVGATKRPVNLTLNGDLVGRARAEGLNLSALAEEAVAAALARRVREKLAAEIAQGCRAHEQYLAEYGSLGDAVRASRDGE